MPTWYTYELWNGKAVLGTITLKYPLRGRYFIVPTISELKREYNKTYEEIEVPTTFRVVSDNGVDRLIRMCLDVRRKSKRQIEIIRQYAP